MSAIATALTGEAHALSPDRYFGIATPGKLAMWIFLISDAFSFGGLLLAYGILRGQVPAAESWHRAGEPELGINFTALLTFWLICSSVTMVLAVASASEGNRRAAVKWLVLTALGGVGFLLGQAEEYFGIFGVFSHGLATEGLWLGHSAYASTFYVTTTFHGMHVLAGTLYILATVPRVRLGKAGASEVEILGLFWHFVDLIWILVFTFIYLL
ncbi:MAG: cytochrome c oxidase subunit 3 [Myxococcales bacterium]|nr:cytochrome c oxidase subunit 3 [Myxococcales bacterium]